MMTDLSEEREDVFLQVTKDRGEGGSCSFLEKKEGKNQFNVCECEIQIGTTQQNSSK